MNRAGNLAEEAAAEVQSLQERLSAALADARSCAARLEQVSAKEAMIGDLERRLRELAEDKERLASSAVLQKTAMQQLTEQRAEVKSSSLLAAFSALFSLSFTATHSLLSPVGHRRNRPHETRSKRLMYCAWTSCT